MHECPIDNVGIYFVADVRMYTELDEYRFLYTEPSSLPISFFQVLYLFLIKFCIFARTILQTV